METFGDKTFDLIEVWLIIGELSTSKIEFKDSKLILGDNYLMISSINGDGELFKVYKLSNIAAFKLKNNKTT